MEKVLDMRECVRNAYYSDSASHGKGGIHRNVIIEP
jgi:hypothetical protein